MNAKWLRGTLCVIALAASQASWPQADYEDRLIDAGNLQPLKSDGDDVHYNASGPPREWRLEGFASHIDQGGTIRRENGLVMSGRLETLEYGAYSLDATVRNGSNASVFTVWQRGLAFDNGWRANNGAGMLNTPAIDLARQQYRFFLPTFPIVGVQSEWIRNGNLQLQASYGAPGTYSGLRVSGFSRLGGTMLTGGAQWSPAPQMQMGFQMADARDIPTGAEDGGAPSKTSARSVRSRLTPSSSRAMPFSRG